MQLADKIYLIIGVIVLFVQSNNFVTGRHYSIANLKKCSITFGGVN